eukprot:850683-Rhodomonas_salina.3
MPTGLGVSARRDPAAMRGKCVGPCVQRIALRACNPEQQRHRPPLIRVAAPRCHWLTPCGHVAPFIVARRNTDTRTPCSVQLQLVPAEAWQLTIEARVQLERLVEREDRVVKGPARGTRLRTAGGGVSKLGSCGIGGAESDMRCKGAAAESQQI